MPNCVPTLGTFKLTRTAERTGTEKMGMIEARELPVGAKPGWELEQPDSDDQESPPPLKGVADR